MNVYKTKFYEYYILKSDILNIVKILTIMGFFKQLALNLVKKKTADGNKERRNSRIDIEKFLSERRASTKGETICIKNIC